MAIVRRTIVTPICYFSVQIVHSKCMYIYHRFEDIFTNTDDRKTLNSQNLADNKMMVTPNLVNFSKFSSKVRFLIGLVV